MLKFNWKDYLALHPTHWRVLLIVVVTAVLLGAYRHYLASLYVMDEVFDAGALRELAIIEKLTIRVEARNKAELKRFLESTSLCQTVHEIQVYWPISSKESTPQLKDFTFAHTHSHIKFIEFDDATKNPALLSNAPIETEGVLLMDPNIVIECSHMKFLQSVWSSSKHVGVGLFPRLHRSYAESGNAVTMSYLDWYYVWWNQKYSLLLSNVIVFHRKQLKELQSVSGIVEILTKHSECYLIVPSLFLSFQSKSSPIWTDIPFKTYSRGSSITDQALSNCLTMTSKVFGITDIPISRSKATIAKKSLIW